MFLHESAEWKKPTLAAGCYGLIRQAFAALVPRTPGNSGQMIRLLLPQDCIPQPSSFRGLSNSGCSTHLVCVCCQLKLGKPAAAAAAAPAAAPAPAAAAPIPAMPGLSASMLAQTAATQRLGAYARPGGIPGFPNMVAMPYQQQVILDFSMLRHSAKLLESSSPELPKMSSYMSIRS